MKRINLTCAVSYIALALLLACSLPTPTPEPTATWTPMPPVPTATPTLTPTPVVVVVTATPAPTATPRFVTLPSVEILTDELAKEIGLGFAYWEFHFVPADTEVRIIYGWPGTDIVYRAVYKFIEGKWKLIEMRVVPTPTPAPPATPGAGREARW